MRIHLEGFPRLRFGHLPTPLEHLPRLSEQLGGPTIYMKRDDCTGLATGGNKTRKLEFLMADAQQQNADTILTQGAVQSNHVRQTAAICAKLGLDCHVLLEERVPRTDRDYRESGNVFLNELFGAHITTYPVDTDMDAALEKTARELAASGRRPYIIPGGGSNPVGALGYVECAMEIQLQAEHRSMPIASVVHATGSCGTQAGLLVGFCGMRSGIPVLGISVRHPAKLQEEKVFDLACRTAEHAGVPGVVRREDVVVDDGYVGAGYGEPSDAMIEAVRLTARCEGILLDPVYSGKGMAGLIGLIRQGKFTGGQNVVFVHTGGSAGLFGYLSTFHA